MMKTKKLKKWYTLAQILLCVTPIMFYIQVSYKLIGSQMDLQALLQQDPAVAISFLVAIINPFVAYQLQYFKKQIEAKDTNIVIFSLMMLMVAQMLLGNIFYVCVLGFLAIQTYRLYKSSWTRAQVFETIRHAWSYMIPNVAIMALSILCFYASMQIM
ncbi:hypothetical protein M2098_000378 [Breznakia sp. PFB1-19]|uniref:hypothetical protein n=2 Tax=unclassified Breznakia TaxID=2623764 RepID=UPI0024751F56|nr:MULTISPECIES: hypothetical protein [unclassified Breznakia]MDH6473158.1 hypothetical protein [Breznakia sp. PFB2-30]MDH6475509.1 hypothetical protein [Breznakia sp. PFB1-19]